MQCKVYESENNSRMFLIVPAGTSLDKLKTPELTRLEPFRLFKTIELSPTARLVGIDAIKAIANIASSGYHIQSVTITVSEKTIPMQHFDAEPHIKHIAIYSDESESTIRLLEVNEEAISTNEAQVFVFSPSDDTEKSVRVIDVTPAEWEKVKSNDISLPDDWPELTGKILSRDEKE